MDDGHKQCLENSIEIHNDKMDVPLAISICHYVAL